MEQIKTVLSDEFPIHRKNYDELGIFNTTNAKCYSLKRKIDEIDLHEFDGYDAVYILPDAWNYDINVLRYVKEKTKLPMVAMFMQPIEHHIYDQGIFMKEFPYFNLFDGMQVHNKAEVSLLSGLFGKQYEVVGSCVDISMARNQEVREKSIATCSRFHWNNAYANCCIARRFPELEYREYLSSNCSNQDRVYMGKCYAMIGYSPKNMPFFFSYEAYIKSLQTNYLAISMEWRHGVGRFVLDCALAGVPCVCSNTLETSWIFGDLMVDPFNIDGAVQKINDLRDDDYYRNIVALAQQRIGMYDTKVNLERYERFIANIRSA